LEIIDDLLIYRKYSRILLAYETADTPSVTSRKTFNASERDLEIKQINTSKCYVVSLLHFPLF